jgi:hypothetical protein
MQLLHLQSFFYVQPRTSTTYRTNEDGPLKDHRVGYQAVLQAMNKAAESTRESSNEKFSDDSVQYEGEFESLQSEEPTANQIESAVLDEGIQADLRSKTPRASDEVSAQPETGCEIDGSALKVHRETAEEGIRTQVQPRDEKVPDFEVRRRDWGRDRVEIQHRSEDINGDDVEMRRTRVTHISGRAAGVWELMEGEQLEGELHKSNFTCKNDTETLHLKAHQTKERTNPVFFLFNERINYEQCDLTRTSYHVILAATA